MNTTNIERGEAVRRALLAVARAAHAKDLPLPTYRRLAASLGLCSVQIHKHIQTLIGEGAITVSRVRYRRFRIESINL